MAVALRRLSFSSWRSHLKSSLSNVHFSRNYAKKIVNKVSSQTTQKFKLEVETDPEKLLKYCCGANIFIDGNDPEIKPDSEYPAWLWTLRTDRSGQDLSELDPSSPEYWKRLSRMTRIRHMKISKRLQRLREIQFPEDKI